MTINTENLKDLTCNVSRGGNLVGSVNALNESARGIAAAVNLLASPTTQQQTVILFGDSFAESQSFAPPPYNGDTLSISLYRFVLGKFGSAFKVVKNAGISGNTAAMMQARYDADVKGASADWVFFNVGVNDFFGLGYTADAVFAQVQDLLTRMRADGFKVLMCNCPPQVTSRSNYSVARATECAKYNKLIFDYVRTINGVTLVDLYTDFVDWSDTTNAGALAKYYGSDGIHLSVLGTILAANKYAEALAPIASPKLSLGTSPLNAGIAGAEGFFAGTGGTNGTGSSGALAASYTSVRVSGTNGTIVNSKLPVGQRQEITLIATNGDMRTRLNGNLNTELTPYIGQRVNVSIRGRLRTVSGGAHLKEFVAKLYTYDGVTITQAVNGTAYAGYPPLADDAFDTGEFTVTLRSITIPSPLNSSGMYFELLLNSVAGCVVQLDLYGFDIRVAD